MNGMVSNGAVEFCLSNCVHEFLGNYIYSGDMVSKLTGKIVTSVSVAKYYIIQCLCQPLSS